MNVTILQTHLYWEDREKNLSHFDGLINSISVATDLIVLPEMFTTGFSMKPETIAEPANGPTLQWLKQKAKEKNAVITGSVAVEENGKYFNRMFWVEPDGSVSVYNKRHLFRLAKEDQHYTAGTEKIIMPLKNWNVCPMVCYDLRFPIWSRNRFFSSHESKVESCELGVASHESAVGSDQSALSSRQSGAISQQAAVGSRQLETRKREPESRNQKPETKSQEPSEGWEYDALIYVANWPEIRSYPWKQLLIARAIENQCYVIGVNRIGADGNNFAHSGDSVVINPRGEIISNTKANEESIETVFLDRNYLDEFRRIFPVGLDADNFELKR